MKEVIDKTKWVLILKATFYESREESVSMRVFDHLEDCQNFKYDSLAQCDDTLSIEVLYEGRVDRVVFETIKGKATQ